MKKVAVQSGDRIDTLALKYLGNSHLYKRLLIANPFLNVWNPKPGQILVIPSVR